MEEPEKDDLVVQDRDDRNYTDRLTLIREREIIDNKYGYQKYTEAEPVNAWLVNVQPSEIFDSSTKAIVAATDFYFIAENRSRLKISYPFRPYLYLGTKAGFEFQVAAYLTKKYPTAHVEHMEKDNLDLKNHLSGLKGKFLFVSFPSTVEMAAFKKEIFPQIRKNQENMKTATDYTAMLAEHLGVAGVQVEGEALEQIIDIREHDLPYHMRVCIDEKIFVGLWYTICGRDLVTQKPSIKRNPDLIVAPDPVVCAFDIETTKLPLKFPDSSIDQIMMISYMIDGRGYLIINREIISADVEDFEYTPKPEFKGEFRVFNEQDEKALLRKFFDHMLRVKPQVMVTYNGDFFDWPFVEARATFHGLNMHNEIGFYKDNQDEFKHISCIHMDAFRWVKRDSYLPVGSQNLKAATKAKLRYDPVELDPELMVPMAKNQPQTLASYSVSDAVSTYYLYMKYVHPFIFALCTIIPLGPDDVLRKGSGTLCEALLMVEAFHNSIIFPNKQIAETHKMTKDGHLLVSETYIGGHVEALESGVFRADIPCKFRMEVDALEQLKAEVKETLSYSLTHEMGIELEALDDLDQVVEEIQKKIDELIQEPMRTENPKIYHLDVGAMYPNIILTNRLQPPSVITEEDCLACVYNTPDAVCKRDMNWLWRGEIIPATKREYERIMQQLEQERFGKPPKAFHTLPKDQRLAIEKKRIQDFCKKSYGRVHEARVEERTSTICERENGFYVNTVRAFRDRRYEYKAMLKKAKNELDAVCEDDVDGRKAGKAKVVLYESLQLAHKCILNSFYGYVMRKGSRWFSMEMAGIVCHTGANIIMEARKLVERIGRPLELDTDGIWCLLPDSFPENYKIKMKNGKSVSVSYPGAMLNALVKDKFTNNQYHNLKPDGTYDVSSENSIFFEVDGPYLAMILPASKEEGKKLKKRYAVFNFDGSLAELKGFEIKRRGELNIIKEFQKDVFSSFLGGKTLQEAYQSAAKVADNWLDVLFTKGVDLRDEELFDLIAENRSMSKKLEEYGSQKSTSITTAKRLAEFLGADMVKNAGLACRYVISQLPAFAPVAERAIPLAIFQSEPQVAAHYLRKWTDSDKISPENINIRELLDWPYYIERLGSCIQKIVTIPAALQGVSNPVPRVAHPDWLENMKKKKIEMACQPKITEIFKKRTDVPVTPVTSRTPRTSQARKRPTPAVFMEDLPENNLNDDDLVELDEAGNVVKRARTEDSSGNIQVTPSRMSNWLIKKKVNQSQTPSTQVIPRKNNEEATIEKKTWKKNGFHEWLMFLKKKWKKQKSDRKAFLRANANLINNSMTFGGRTNLESMLAFGRDKLSKENWHILQIAETKSPGIFDVFAFVGGILKRFSLNIPRVFYVNYLNKLENSGGKPVQKILPRMQPCHFLYEYTADESKFRAEMKKFNSQLCAGHVAGIYETQVPLLFRAFIQMGSIVKLKEPSNSLTYNLQSFDRISPSDTEYVDLTEIKSMFFYEFSQAPRTIFALISPKTSQGFFFIVNRGRIELRNLTNIYVQLYERFAQKENIVLPPKAEGIQFESFQLASLKEASKQLGNLMKTIRTNSSEPMLLCLQTNRRTSELLDVFPCLKELPNVRVGAPEPAGLLNILDWGDMMAKRVMQHFLNSYTYLQDSWAIAQYVGIPVGNIPEDVSSLALDIFYARALQQKNHLLWASTSSSPDLGGKEMLDYRLTADWDTVAFKQHHGRIINEQVFEHENCIADLEIGAVAVTALIQNIRIVEAEGTSEIVGYSNNTPNVTIDKLVTNGMRPTTSITEFDEAASVSSALKILRQVFHELIKDIHTNENVFADQLVVHLYRWMSDPGSLLYNSAIFSSVNILMKKLCLLLSTEVKRLGGTVIHCSFSRMVLTTGRQDSNQSKVFVASLADTLAKNPIFAALQITPVHLWNACLWLDPTNFCSVGFHEEEKENEVAIDERVESHFAMVEELPKRCREAFRQVIIGFFMLIAREARKGLSEEELTDFKIKLLSTELGPRLFQITERLTKIRGSLNEEYRNNRPLDADELDRELDIPLEFVKAVCKALSLDKNLMDSVENLRSQLIQLLRSSSTKTMIEWQAPSAVCVLENIFCIKCNQCINLDLSIPSDDGLFHCCNCKAEISNDTVDELLVKRLDKIVTSFVVQDLKCKKCGQQATKYLARYCECSNSFELTIPMEEFIHILKVIYRIAQDHQLLFTEVTAKKRIQCYELVTC